MNVLRFVLFCTVMLARPLLAQMAPGIEFPSDDAAKSFAKRLVATAEQARRQYEDGVAHGEVERSRERYVTRLADILYQYLQVDKGSAWNYLESGCDAVYNELQRHPAPKNADSKALSKILVGEWTSPRHDYLYRKNGTWIMLPAEKDSSGGVWHIQGNQYYEFQSSYTIILLNKNYFIFTDEKNGPFFERRTTK